MGLATTTILSGLSTAIAILSGFLVSKAVAVLTGPKGVALIGQFQDVSTFCQTIGGGMFASAIITNSAAQPAEANAYLGAAVRQSLILSFVVGGTLAFVSPWLAVKILADKQYAYLLILLGVLLIFVTFRQLGLALLNGLGRIREYTILNISGSILILVMTIAFTRLFSLQGALLSTILAPVTVSIATIYIMTRNLDLSLPKLFSSNSNEVPKWQLYRFALMSLASGIAGPISLAMIRTSIATGLSWVDAGYWQGVVRISTGYLTLITTALGVYYLPKISAATTKKGVYRELVYVGKFALPAVAILAVIIFILREKIILLLYAPDFLVATDLFAWQLTGDFFKITSWLFSIVILAKGRTFDFIALEVVFSSTAVVLTYLALPIWGLQGAVMSYCANYIFYLLACSGVMIWRVNIPNLDCSGSL